MCGDGQDKERSPGRGDKGGLLEHLEGRTPLPPLLPLCGGRKITHELLRILRVIKLATLTSVLKVPKRRVSIVVSCLYYPCTLPASRGHRKNNRTQSSLKQKSSLSHPAAIHKLLSSSPSPSSLLTSHCTRFHFCDQPSMLPASPVAAKPLPSNPPATTQTGLAS